MNFATPCKVEHRRIVDADGKWLGEAYPDDAHGESIPLATLWAAAPELLAACRSAMRRFSDQNGIVDVQVWNDNYPAVKALAEAIAKAEGA